MYIHTNIHIHTNIYTHTNIHVYRTTTTSSRSQWTWLLSVEN